MTTNKFRVLFGIQLRRGETSTTDKSQGTGCPSSAPVDSCWRMGAGSAGRIVMMVRRLLRVTPNDLGSALGQQKERSPLKLAVCPIHTAAP